MDRKDGYPSSPYVCQGEYIWWRMKQGIIQGYRTMDLKFIFWGWLELWELELKQLFLSCSFVLLIPHLPIPISLGRTCHLYQNISLELNIWVLNKIIAYRNWTTKMSPRIQILGPYPRNYTFNVICTHLFNLDGEKNLELGV